MTRQVTQKMSSTSFIWAFGASCIPRTTPIIAIKNADGSMSNASTNESRKLVQIGGIFFLLTLALKISPEKRKRQEKSKRRMGD